MIPAPDFALSRRADRAGNALIVAIMFVALFAVITGAVYVLTSETQRHAARETRYSSIQTAGDAAMDVLYGRYTHWVDANTGRTPSNTDAATAGIPTNASFPKITAPIDFSSASGLSGYTVSNISLCPVQGDDTPDWSGTTKSASQPKNSHNATPPPFPSASSFYPSSGSPTAPAIYQGKVNSYYISTPNLYEPASQALALTYQAQLTVTPTAATGSLQPNPITVTRYFQKSEVTPFNYNIFTVGTFEDPDWGQAFDSEASIYASVNIKLDHKGTIVNGVMRYGGAFYDPTGVSGGTNNLVFQDPTTGATVDPYASGLLRQVATKIEVVPALTSVLAYDSSGNRVASTEFSSAADNFSRRELIEPPANVADDTAPQTIQDRRIFTQADMRLKISVGTTTSTSGGKTTTTTTVTGTFYNQDGSKLATYTGTPTSPTTTSWTAGSGANSATSAAIAAVSVNTVNSSTPFYDATRALDAASLGSGQPGQPTAANYKHAIETVDVNVGTLTSAIASGGGVYGNNILYIWDDGASGEKNGVRLYNGGVLPSGGLTVGSTNPVYIKGDYNTGTVLPSSDINASAAAVQPVADTVGWNGGNMASYDDRHVPGYTPKPAGVFGDTITTLSQNWKDANSTSTQYATSTTYNTVMGFGSGKDNELLKDDTFVDGTYAGFNVLEVWKNTRWNQLGEQMALYHSIYNKQKAAPSWGNGGWAVIQNDFDAGTAHVPLKWGYLVFSRGRYTQN